MTDEEMIAILEKHGYTVIKNTPKDDNVGMYKCTECGHFFRNEHYCVGKQHSTHGYP